MFLTGLGRVMLAADATSITVRPEDTIAAQYRNFLVASSVSSQ
jgi:hypothetical protein